MPNPAMQVVTAESSDDERLLRRTATGDMAAFAVLVRTHQARVIRLATRLLSSPHQAEDIAQEAFLRVFRSAARFEPRAQFSTWLYRIVVNLCHDERRRWRLRLSGVEGDATSPNCISSLELSELKTAVHRAIDKLPPRQRAALILHRFEELSIREIAQVCDSSESAVESLLVRAYAHLRESLQGTNDQ